jgi:hypothetical protein
MGLREPVRTRIEVAITEPVMATSTAPAHIEAKKSGLRVVSTPLKEAAHYLGPAELSCLFL